MEEYKSIETKIEDIEKNSTLIQESVDKIISPFCEELDNYVDEINKSLLNNDYEDEDLDDFVLNLSTLLYYITTGTEQIGIRDDVSKTAYKEMYNNIRSSIDKGTVADKNTQAELQSLEEHIVNVVYNKAYKILKAKSESAQELLASCKKVISRRQAAIELSRTDVRR